MSFQDSTLFTRRELPAGMSASMALVGASHTWEIADEI